MANRRTPDIPPVIDPARTPAMRRPARAPELPPAPPRLKLTADARRAMIAQNAFLRAERRGFAPGGEKEDWLAAEVEVDALLKLTHGGSPQ
jgi:hypothetical protein